MTPTNSSASGIEPCTRDDDNSLGATLSYLYYFMFAFSVVTSILVLVIIRRFEKLNTVINILLVNLVASSLIFMSSLPFLGVYMQLSDWVFGSALCKIIFTVYYLGFYSSVFFLTLLTLDRYLAFVHVMPVVHLRSRRNALISCTVVWLISGLACIRPMLLQKSFRFLDKCFCEEDIASNQNADEAEKRLKKSGFYIQLVVFLILPLAVIIFCYIRIAITIMASKTATKFHAVRVIFIIVVLFFICWIPFNIVVLLHYDKTDCETEKKLGYALHVTRNMAYFYFCISPIFYTFVGRKFQEHFKQLLVKCFPSLKNHISFSTEYKTAIATTRTDLSIKK